jgi:diguanylate cyclase (GGDEF)-like protein
MGDNPKEHSKKELLFQRRLAELRSKNEQFPWTLGDTKADFEIPKEESKLLAEKELDRDLSQSEVERRALLELASLSFNFRTFYKRVHYELRRAKRYTRPLSVLLVAVDRLEEVGNKGGSDAKTQVIEAAARVVLSSIRDVDIPGRCREDVFGIILPETPRSGAEVAAERLRTKLEDLNVVAGWQHYTITASVGACCYPGRASEAEELFAQVVEVLLATMRSGGNSVAFAEP